MESVTILLNQIIIMFLLMVCGYLCYRKKLINDDGSQQMANLLLYVCNPAVMIQSFLIPFSMEKLTLAGISFIASVIVILLGILSAKLFLKKQQRIEKFGVIFCNSGFLGIPLVSNVLGSDCIFYLTIYMAAFSLFAWSYGIILISNRKDLVSIKKMIINPATLSLMVGLLFFVTSQKVPEVVKSTMQLLANMNTPLAMIVLGTYLAKSDLLSIWKNKIGYQVSILRLLIAPLFALVALSLFPASMNDMKLTLLIAGSTPCAVLLAMFSQQYGANFAYGARIVCLSTLLSLLTMPLLLLFAQMIW